MNLNQYIEKIIDFNKAINFSPKNASFIFIVIYLNIMKP